jgi:hypothetical protein
MFKKIKDWLGTNLDVYKVEKADDVGTGLVRHKWQGEQTATQIGTTLTADILNNFQKGLIPFVETVRTTGTDKDIYTVSVNGLKEFGLFDGLKLLLQIDNENQYNNSVININDSEYPLYSVKNGANEAVKKGSLRTKGYYFITYNQNAFYLNAGNILGTETDTVLEGKRLAEIIGLEYGGNIQDTGAKVTGKFYYDKALKYYYECIANNNLTYNDGSKFRAISNKPLSDKVENLSSVESYAIDSRLTVGVIHKIGNICILTVDSNEVYNGRNYGEVLFNIPEKFRPKFLTPVSVGIINSASGGAAHIETNGNVVWRGARTSSALYINAVYLAK